MTKRRILPIAIGILVLWVIVAGIGGPLLGKLSSVQNNDSASFLPDASESTVVSQRLDEFQTETTLPLLLVVEADEGKLTKAEIGQLGEYAGTLPKTDVTGVDRPLGDFLAQPKIPVVPSKDGEAAMLIVSLDAAAVEKTSGEDTISDLIVEDLRGDNAPDVASTTSLLTGPAGFTADLGEAFAGIDGLLLLVTLAVVLLILLIVYRSPILPFAVLLTSVFGLALAALVIYPMADAGWIELSGQSQGILFILVVGAATDYSLLLVARYREELHHHDPLVALRTAWLQSWEPIAASGFTVAAGLLCLLLSDLGNISGLGPIGALGIVGAMASALTLLPALLVLLGRAAFWPSVPRPGTRSEHKLWRGVGDRVTKRPRLTWIGTSAALLLAALAALQFNASGISQAEFFTTEVESVTGQDVLDEHFPSGDQQPVQIIAPSDSARDVRATVRDTDGVAQVDKGVKSQEGDDTLLSATLTDGSETEAAQDTVRDLRDRLSDEGDVLVGGSTASTVDTDDASARDQRVVIPAIVLVVTVILIFLLRSVLAAALLVAINVLTFVATLGISALVFNHVFDFPSADPSTPLLGFVFLVALAVDYSIFLMTRAREEAMQVGTRVGIRHALAVTGGVITSAGVVLAATFSALWVIPLLFLAQIAFIVAFGVLLDTLVTRSVLVPALATDLGNRIWWPGQRRMAPDGPRHPGTHRADPE